MGGPSCAKPDYDGDGRSDIAVYRPATGEWFINGSATNTNIYYAWGAPASTGAGDIPVPGDYDGDGQTDVAVYRQTTRDVVHSIFGRWSCRIGLRRAFRFRARRYPGAR